MNALLTELQDIHLPPPPGIWPPAPGWWLLAALLLVLLAGVTGWRRLRFAPRRAALGELAMLESAWRHDGDAHRFAVGVSRLLRRVALLHHRRSEVAALSGPSWLAFLDAHGGDGRFAGAAGEALLCVYRPDPSPDGEALLAATRHWMAAQPW